MFIFLNFLKFASLSVFGFVAFIVSNFGCSTVLRGLNYGCIVKDFELKLKPRQSQSL